MGYRNYVFGLFILTAISLPAVAAPVHIYRQEFSLPIPADPAKTAGPMTDAIIEVSEHYMVGDIDVGITLTHDNVFDLRIFLQSPSGTKICLNSYNLDKFFVGSGYAQTVFDDEAEVPIHQGQPPFVGRFKPVGPQKLSRFDGEDAFGLWKLQIHDLWAADTGMLESAELMITAPEPATVVLFALGWALACSTKARRKK